MKEKMAEVKKEDVNELSGLRIKRILSSPLDKSFSVPTLWSLLHFKP